MQIIRLTLYNNLEYIGKIRLSKIKKLKYLLIMYCK